MYLGMLCFFFKQKTAYELRISDWSSDVCSSDLRLNAGIIVEAPMAEVRFGNGRRLGRVEEYFASTLAPGDTFAFAGLSLAVEAIRDADLILRATTPQAPLPSYLDERMAISTRPAHRVRGVLAAFGTASCWGGAVQSLSLSEGALLL